ncbi:hypothetical protein AGMMS49546_23010 [Spirochaetia bacterium]|nr:hypothetical protein AGMMS49546_23010 [Spirochaetia bacterium]
MANILLRKIKTVIRRMLGLRWANWYYSLDGEDAVLLSFYQGAPPHAQGFMWISERIIQSDFQTHKLSTKKAGGVSI